MSATRYPDKQTIIDFYFLLSFKRPPCGFPGHGGFCFVSKE